MARIALNCSCSWSFFIAGTTTGHEVSCPACGNRVRIPGRKPGMDLPLSPGAVAAKIQQRRERVRLITGAVTAMVVVGAIYAGLSRPEQAPVTPPGSGTTSTGRNKPPPGGPSAGIYKPPDPPPPKFTAAQIADLKADARNCIGLISLSIVGAEINRLRNLPGPSGEFQSKADVPAAKLESCRAKLSEVNEADSPESLARGDQILRFAGTDLSSMKPGEAAQVLHNWAIAWSPDAGPEQVVVVRAGEEFELTLQVPVDKEAWRSLLDHPALKAEVLESGFASDRVAIPDKLVKQWQSGMDALHTGYRKLVPAHERSRLQTLLDRRMAPSAEIEWFEQRVLGVLLPGFERDVFTLKAKVDELNPLIQDTAFPDALYRKSGQRLDGKIIEEGPEQVKFMVGSTGGGIPKVEIERIAPGQGIGKRVLGLLGEAKDSVEKLALIMDLCAKNKLMSGELKYMACRILLLDPANAVARSASGVARP